MINAFITMPTSTPTDLAAQLTSQITDPGTLTLIILVIGIPLFFYVITRLIDLVDKDRSSAPPLGPHYGIYDKKTGAFKRLEKIK